MYLHLSKTMLLEHVLLANKGHFRLDWFIPLLFCGLSAQFKLCCFFCLLGYFFQCSSRFNLKTYSSRLREWINRIYSFQAQMIKTTEALLFQVINCVCLPFPLDIDEICASSHECAFKRFYVQILSLLITKVTLGLHGWRDCLFFCLWLEVLNYW